MNKMHGHSDIPSRQVRNMLCVALTSAATVLIANSGLAAEPIFALKKTTDLSKLKTKNTTVSMIEDNGQWKLNALFKKTGYPKVAFPCPEKGWNLKDFKGIEIKVQNKSAVQVRAALRIDNPGSEKDQFWNTESRLLKPGESGIIKSVFGENNGKAGYPLDSTRITAYQIFLIDPKEDVQMFVGEPKGYGTPDKNQTRVRYSVPEDRNKPVVTPKWLGQRPPVDGDWVMTLDENFSSNALNASVWGNRLAMVGPEGIETQRYIDENVIIENGVAHLKTEINPGHQYDDPNLPTRKYAAGLLTSYDRWTQCFGYFEMRTKLPTTKGLSPVFTLIPDRGSASGLNVHARRAGHDFQQGKKGMAMNVFTHLPEWDAGRISVSTVGGRETPAKNWSDRYVYYGPTEDGWHTFGLLWEPNKLTWYVDGVKKSVRESDSIATVLCYLYIAQPMGRGASKNVDEASLPDFWDIDYVRVWQRVKDANKTNSN